jgi:hypothetical protein
MYMETKYLQKVEGSQLLSCLFLWLQVYFQHSLVFVFVFVLDWCSGFFIFCFSMSPWATMQALSFSSFPGAVCFAFKTSLTGMICSSLRDVLPSMKVSWSIKFLIFILIACNQALRTSSSSFRTALKDCGSERYLSTCSSLEDEAVALMVNMAV